MTIRETLERISDLNKEISTLQTKEIDNLVREKIIRYERAGGLTGHSDYPTKTNLIEDWTVYGNCVTGSWEEFWSYGGHAQGTFSIPINYIVNDGDLESFERECLAHKEEKEKKEKQARIAAVQAELNRLTSL